jgi:hypothetical protein
MQLSFPENLKSHAWYLSSYSLKALLQSCASDMSLSLTLRSGSNISSGVRTMEILACHSRSMHGNRED